MRNYLIPINDLPQDGRDFTLDDQEIWLGPLKEFKMDCRITTPLKMELKVLPAENGCLLRGVMTGGVVMPCNRCAEDANVEIQSKFDEFEEIPEEPARGHKETENESHISFENHVPMLNLADVAWEQFMLSLPPNPLCRPDCKGLCPQCGANLNLGPCDCREESADPRMAVLRDVKIAKKR